MRKARKGPLLAVETLGQIKAVALGVRCHGGIGLLAWLTAPRNVRSRAAKTVEISRWNSSRKFSLPPYRNESLLHY